MNTPTPISPDITQEYDEEDYQRHIANEGNRHYNQHPDGCYFCGSDYHHSDCCPEKP